MLLILDEVMCGMGRTGTLFACEQEGVRPDLVTIAKGLGAGYQAIGATLASRAIYDAIVAGSGFFQHGYTYMAHPTACAAGLAVQQAIVEEQLLDRVRQQGARLRALLVERFGGHAHVGDIRGRGLLQALELVADRASKRPFAPDLRLHARVRAEALARGLMIYAMGGTIDGQRGDHILRAAVHRDRCRSRDDRRPPRGRARCGARTYGSGRGMTPLVVMVAPNGARRTKADHLNLPLTPAEIAREAELCCAAGASVLHVHVRDQDDSHSLDPDLYRAAIAAVRQKLGDRMVIQITTEAVGRYGPAEQMATVRAVHPEAVSLGLMELIPDDQAIDAAAAFLAWLQGERIAPQYILYSPSEVARLHDLRRSGVIPQRRPFALFVLGRYGDQTEAQPRDVLPFLAAHDADCPWAVCAFGPREGACVLTAAGLGGHVRVGFENNLRLADGRLATSNAELVAQVTAGARLLGREVADIATTARSLPRRRPSGLPFSAETDRRALPLRRMLR